MRHAIRQIGTLPPLQRATAQIIPMSAILGGKAEKTNVIGNALADLITISRVSDLMPVYDMNLRVTCTSTGKFKIENVDTGYVTTEKDATSSQVEITEFSGIKITVASGLTGAVADDICDIGVYGDSTFIVPGTILGRIKDEKNDYFGQFEPIKSDLTKYDVLRVCGGTVETNKANFVAPVSDTMNNDDKYTVDVYVFGQVIENVCRSINMTNDAKKKIEGIVWE